MIKKEKFKMSIKFGSDFFTWFRIVIEFIKIITKYLGDESDQEELKKNGFDT